MSDTPHYQSPLDTGLEDYSLEKREKDDKFDISALNQAELLALRTKIEAKITGTTLSELNLVKETLFQFQSAKVLQAEAGAANSDVPMNQRAQVQNSIAKILDQLGKIQMELYSSEKLKRLQAAVIKIVKQLPKPQQDTFFEQIESDFQVAEMEVDQVEQAA